MANGLPPITRPDGRLYRPRKVVACAVNDGDDLIGGVVVFGTHDVERAARLAQDFTDWQIGRGYAPAVPLTVWWRDAMCSGQRTFEYDEKRGRAGVYFTEIVEAPVPAGAP
jgi:hypothetical protein